eukprot:9346019-Alexandrium_andersonii.AAC.1
MVTGVPRDREDVLRVGFVAPPAPIPVRREALLLQDVHGELEDVLAVEGPAVPVEGGRPELLQGHAT